MPISPQQHAEIEQRLKQSRQDVMDSVSSRIRGESASIAPATHTAQNEDKPQAEMISHNEEHYADRETAVLHEIDAALGRLETGGYGICVECGREIAVERLMATPTVHTCIQCQEMLEREQRRVNGSPPQI
jgi:RNA polymerase-binding protein DksA